MISTLQRHDLQTRVRAARRGGGGGGSSPSQELHHNEGADGDPCCQAHPQEQPVSEPLLRPPAFRSGVLPKEFSKTFLRSRQRGQSWLEPRPSLHICSWSAGEASARAQVVNLARRFGFR